MCVVCRKQDGKDMVLDAGDGGRTKKLWWHEKKD